MGSTNYYIRMLLSDTLGSSFWQVPTRSVDQKWSVEAAKAVLLKWDMVLTDLDINSDVCWLKQFELQMGIYGFLPNQRSTSPRPRVGLLDTNVIEGLQDHLLRWNAYDL